MNDLISYCKNTDVLKAELVELGYYNEESGTYTHGMIMTPIIKNGLKSLSLIRGDIITLKSIEILGTYDEIFADPKKDAKYKSVYPYDKPIEYEDENGDIKSYLRPKKIGLFA